MFKIILASMLVLICVTALCSCDTIHKTLSRKASITFDANGGIVTGIGVDTDGMSDPEVYTAKCVVGDELTDYTAARDYYDFLGWFTERDAGKKVTSGPEESRTLYAHWESANKDRSVGITDIKVSGGVGAPSEGMIRISADESENDLTVTFSLSKWFGQEVYFVTKKGKEKQKIAISENGGEVFTDGPSTVSCKLPDRKWMNHKEYSYYIQSMGNDHVDESEITEVRVVLDGQCEDFNMPIEGSMVWYGGPDEAPEGRAGIILATDDDHVYARDAAGGDTIYIWKKSDVMINLADVRTDIVYDIYNAYDSRFFPVRGRAMYSDNGQGGLKRYDYISKEDAVHENRKTGQVTFMVPVQWDFAETVAGAETAARNMGVTLYIVDTFRPMDSVGPVAKKVDDQSLLASGGTSAHNFGLAVDTGWQPIDENGDPAGEPYIKNLQELDKKKAVKGPRGNEHELWWEDVNKLPQEWWHYGDSTLPAGFSEHARRVGDLYVNQGECASMKRSRM